MRRFLGYDLQYFATIEPQRRLAPHAHMALRGAISRADLRRVIAATYHQQALTSARRKSATRNRSGTYRARRKGHGFLMTVQRLGGNWLDVGLYSGQVLTFGGDLW